MPASTIVHDVYVPHDIWFDVFDVFVGVREQFEELSQNEGKESDE